MSYHPHPFVEKPFENISNNYSSSLILINKVFRPPLSNSVLRFQIPSPSPNSVSVLRFRYYKPGVPAMPSGFPLYLCSLRSQRMPLQSLTRQALLSVGESSLINKVFQTPSPKSVSVSKIMNCAFLQQ